MCNKVWNALKLQKSCNTVKRRDMLTFSDYFPLLNKLWRVVKRSSCIFFWSHRCQFWRLSAARISLSFFFSDICGKAPTQHSQCFTHYSEAMASKKACWILTIFSVSSHSLRFRGFIETLACVNNFAPSHRLMDWFAFRLVNWFSAEHNSRFDASHSCLGPELCDVVCFRVLSCFPVS